MNEHTKKHDTIQQSTKHQHWRQKWIGIQKTWLDTTINLSPCVCSVAEQSWGRKHCYGCKWQCQTKQNSLFPVGGCWYIKPTKKIFRVFADASDDKSLVSYHLRSDLYGVNGTKIYNDVLTREPPVAGMEVFDIMQHLKSPRGLKVAIISGL